MSDVPDPGALEGARPSPNIWHHTTTYEIENTAADPDGHLGAALHERVDWRGRDVLDVGCGTGFHLAWFAADAATVIGVEPHPTLAAIARRRTRRVGNVEVLDGTAQSLPLADDSIDVAHARWAYFFGPGCEPGLVELARVLRPGGVALIVDNDPTRSTFGSWFTRGHLSSPHRPSPSTVQAFWRAQGFARTRVDMGWRFASRADLEAVVRIELPPTAAEQALTEQREDDLYVDYAVDLWSRTF